MTDLIPSLIQASDSKIVLVVMDGLGGFRTSRRGSEIFEARTPNLDALAGEGSSGIHHVVGPGITPGSGAGHLALFGYDPNSFHLGRGALSAAGVGFALQAGDVAARVNFCTLDDSGLVLDRRAGRISTEENQRLVGMILRAARDLGVEISLVPEREHRALLVLRGPGLSPAISDSDPQMTGAPPKAVVAHVPEAKPTADVVNRLLDIVRTVLKDEKANYLLLRGFDTLRPIPSFPQRNGMRAIGIACYPMYLGLARILGMEVAPQQNTFEEEVKILASSWLDFDFFYIHHKKTDSAGEDGDFDRKVAAIEEVDSSLPAIIDLAPDVICVTGDHSTPAPMRSHSWHPVPFLMKGENVGVDQVERFDEENARRGGLGERRAVELMPLMLAAAGRLIKYGA